jgi:hypothetical protein
MLKEYDSFSGVTETFTKDKMTGKISVNRSQDISSIVSANTAEQNAIGNNNWKGDMHKVASIPVIVWEQWIRELQAKNAQSSDPAHNSNRTFLIGKLNDYNYSKLRTKKGRV